ncbi:putative methionyl-tRNA formyltransferase [Cyclospora cayetanensis]|uniref:Methionyl-tRNA formyltransferase n=1 Tax=Cyclospora cayetanensis TaxID=88456 RepID=A0A1D3D7W7_9EIME|nr:putative methionyl-tRNA formyltransferase [Cyclospora cayetanensis]
MSKSLVAATSGALAACASTVAVFPLDTLLVHHQASVSKQPRTLLQHQQKRHRSVLQALIDALQELLQQEDAASVAGSTPKTRRHKSTLTDLVNRISRLYSGLGIKLAEQVARNFVYFYLYQALKSRAAKRFGSLGTAGTLLMAVLAALGTQLLTAPLDVTSTHAQLCRLPLRTIFLRILRTEGPWGFYRGFGAALCLCANPAITNATFDSLKLWLQMVNLLRSRRFMDPITDDDTPVERFGQVLPPLTALQSFLLGAISKAFATVATYPYIRAKVLPIVNARLYRALSGKGYARGEWGEEDDRGWLAESDAIVWRLDRNPYCP